MLNLRWGLIKTNLNRVTVTGFYKQKSIPMHQHYFDKNLSSEGIFKNSSCSYIVGSYSETLQVSITYLNRMNRKCRKTRMKCLVYTIIHRQRNVL